MRSPDVGQASAPPPRKVEEILLARGKITSEQLEEARLLQQEDRREVGQILLTLGYITKADLAEALANRLRLDHVELTEADVDGAAASLVEQKVLRRHGAMPLRVEGGRLLVAMSDPTNFYALEDLRMISGYPITPVVAVDDEIRRVLDKVFAVGEEVADLLGEPGSEAVVEDYGEVELENDVSGGSAPVVRFVSSVLRRAVDDGASAPATPGISRTIEPPSTTSWYS